MVCSRSSFVAFRNYVELGIRRFRSIRSAVQATGNGVLAANASWMTTVAFIRPTRLIHHLDGNVASQSNVVLRLFRILPPVALDLDHQAQKILVPAPAVHQDDEVEHLGPGLLGDAVSQSSLRTTIFASIGS